MTVERAGKLWEYGPSQIKRLRKLCLSMPGRFPLVAGHITIPDNTPKIFVPDGRSKKSRNYFIRYLLDAIGTDSLLYPESIGITEADEEAHLKALLDNHEIERKSPNSTSWETVDFMIPRSKIWGRKTAGEKRNYISNLIESLKHLAYKK